MIGQAIMRKFEYFPIWCRANRAIELYKKSRPNPSVSGIQIGNSSKYESENNQTEAKKTLKSKVGDMMNKVVTSEVQIVVIRAHWHLRQRC
jgi:hypothetical protein